MFIEIQEKGKRKKYYLAHAFRFEGKPRKIRRYLGANLSPEELKKLKQQAEMHIKEQLKQYREISDPFRTALSPKEVAQLQSLDISPAARVFHLSEENWKEFAERFAYDTNAIEGSTVTFPEVKQIVEKHEWPKGATKGEISETYGVTDAIRYIRKAETHLSVELVKKLHKIVFQNSKPYAGKFRPKGIEVAVRTSAGEVVHRGAPSTKVYSLLADLVKWYRGNKEKYPPLVLAVVTHNQFETIHPFQDGNGRVGRLLLNNILLRHNLPPVNIQLRSRGEYYDALQSYQKQGNIRPMIELVLKEYKEMEKMLKKR